MGLTVAFDHQIFSVQRYGGVSRYFVELASRLPPETVAEVRIVAPFHINNYLRTHPVRGFTQGRYVPFDFSGVWRAVRMANRIAAPLAWTNIAADLIHETYFTTKPVGEARRRVVTVHDMIHELFTPRLGQADDVIVAKRAAFSRADHLICVSETTRRDLHRFYDIDPARTSVVHHGHSFTSAVSCSRPTSQQVPVRGHRPSLLYVGNRTGYKNFRALLTAYSRSTILRDFDLVAFGGPPPVSDEWEEIERLGLAGKVRFQSGSDRDLAEHYRTATAFVYPSMYEGFGMPPLEAMSYGCPVVCSNAGAIPEVVGDAGVYFDPKDPAELQAVLEGVATSERLQEDLRSSGYRRLTTFSWDRCAEKTALIYREIM